MGLASNRVSHWMGNIYEYSWTDLQATKAEECPKFNNVIFEILKYKVSSLFYTSVLGSSKSTHTHNNNKDAPEKNGIPIEVRITTLLLYVLHETLYGKGLIL